MTATTGVNGVAVATLRLTQKNGPYFVTARTMRPGGEAHYLSSSESVPFTIGK